MSSETQSDTARASPSPENGFEKEVKLEPDLEAMNGEKPESSSSNVGMQAPPIAKDSNIVDFDGPDDPYKPLNWPMRKKLVTTFLYSFTTMGATWASTM